RYVGKTVAEKLCEHFVSIERLKNASYEEIREIHEVGERIAQSVTDFFKDAAHIDLTDRLEQAGVQMQAKEPSQLEGESLKGLTFVVSGVFSLFDREELKAVIKANGGKVAGTISGNTDYLVAGDKMGPAKKEKAEKLKVKIIDEQQFQAMLTQL
ncbi:MAG: NAD-dependent DNA ligase LigA, partial [Cyclobacteriaceae bacterium]|nr:NAD-dependent DNA ligase LigA [Cyclobacteriaceae bacterium]